MKRMLRLMKHCPTLSLRILNVTHRKMTTLSQSGPINGRQQKTRSYLKLPAMLQKRTCNPNSSPHSQATVIKNKAKHVENHLHVITCGNEWLSEHVLMRVAKDRGLCCLKEDNAQISMNGVLVIKDFVPGTMFR